MHETIAKATHKGERRRIGEIADRYYMNQIIRRSDKKSRRAWVDEQIQFLLGPESVLFGSWTQKNSTRSKPVVSIICAALTDLDKWAIFIHTIDSRKFTVSEESTYVRIALHLVDRIMQRLGTENSLEAVKLLKDTVLYANQLCFMKHEPPYLLPLSGASGAVIAVQDKDISQGVMLVTYVDEDKLRAEQKVELALWTEIAEGHINESKNYSEVRQINCHKEALEP